MRGIVRRPLHRGPRVSTTQRGSQLLRKLAMLIATSAQTDRLTLNRALAYWLAHGGNDVSLCYALPITIGTLRRVTDVAFTTGTIKASFREADNPARLPHRRVLSR